MENNVLTRARGYFSLPLLSLADAYKSDLPLNRKLIHNRLYSLADAYNSDLPSTGNLLTFTSLALQPPFKTTTTLSTPCMVPCFNML